MGEKPTAAFVLSLIGAIFYILIGIGVAALAAVFGSILGIAGAGAFGLGIALVGAVGLVSGIVMIIGAAMMYSSDRSRVRTGSVLVFTLVGAIFTFGGAVIGFILALIGSILGLTWKPPMAMPPPPPPS